MSYEKTIALCKRISDEIPGSLVEITQAFGVTPFNPDGSLRDGEERRAAPREARCPHAGPSQDLLHAEQDTACAALGSSLHRRPPGRRNLPSVSLLAPPPLFTR